MGCCCDLARFHATPCISRLPRFMAEKSLEMPCWQTKNRLGHASCEARTDLTRATIASRMAGGRIGHERVSSAASSERGSEGSNGSAPETAPVGEKTAFSSGFSVSCRTPLRPWFERSPLRRRPLVRITLERAAAAAPEQWRRATSMPFWIERPARKRLRGGCGRREA
jgi:hypothetical protein